jgi:TonB family protein
MAGITLSFRTALIAVVTCTVAAPLVAQEPEPLQIFAQFKSALDANDLARAQAQAETLVSTLERRHGKDAQELVNPLTNLGTVQFRRGELLLAESSFQRAINLIEGQRAGADRQLIRPLHGLGETWLANGRPAEATVALKRAVDLSRNLDGLYNFEQLDIVDALIEGYVALGRDLDADREHQFAFRIAETQFGKRDLRLLDPLNRFARWHESMGRYSTARGLHARALQLAEELSTDQPKVGVPALQGLARTWMLEAIYGPEATEGPPVESPDPGDSFSGSPGQARLNPDGLRALTFAAEIARKTLPLDSKLLGETLAQVGDWHLLAGNLLRANSAYSESYAALNEAGPDARRLLDSPRRLIYRPPAISATRMRPLKPDEYVLTLVEMRLKIGKDGKVRDAVIGNSSAPENSNRAALLAARKARFAPRIENGQPVETEGVLMTEQLLIKTQREPVPTN